MHCSDANRQLQLYIDRRLTMQQVRELEVHIDQCAACQHQLFLLEEVASTLHNLQPVAEPEDMTILIMQRVRLWSSYGSSHLFAPSCPLPISSHRPSRPSSTSS